MRVSSAIDEILPLAPLQAGLLFHALHGRGESDLYRIQQVWELRGPLDEGALIASLQRLLARHPALRASFHYDELRQPVQVIARTVDLPFSRIDLSGEVPEVRARHLARAIDEEKQARLDVTRAPLLRVVLAKLGPEHHQLLLTVHHIVVDGWSLAVLIEELWRDYGRADRQQMSATSTSFRAYAAWLAAQDAAVSQQVWRDVLRGLVSPTLVVPQRSSASGSSPARLSFALSAAVTQSLHRRARRSRVTLSSCVRAAWAIVVSHLTSQSDVVFGATVATRPADVRDVERLVGLCINTVPVRVALNPAEALERLVQRVQAQQVTTLSHEYLGLADIQQEAGLGTLFDTLVVVENYPTSATPEGLAVAGLQIRRVSTGEATHYPLTLFAVDADVLHLRLDVWPDACAVTTAEACGDAVVRVLETLATAPTTAVGDLVLASVVAERRRIVQGEAASSVERLDSLAALVEAQVLRTPDAAAIVSGDEVVSYDVLNARANQLARYLLARGVGPESTVAVMLSRSPELVVTLLAIMKAGGAYVPIDPDTPPQRRQALIDEVRPALMLMLTDGPAACGPADSAVTAIDLRAALSAAANLDKAPIRSDERRSTLSLEHPAYVLCTSGSTGKPKGVIVTHRSAVALVNWARGAYRAEELARVLVSSSACFDLSVFELFVPLSTGGTACVVENLLAVAQWPGATGITLVNTVPSALAALLRLRREWIRDATINLAGETLSAALVNTIYAHEGPRRLLNLYGPTEDTTYSTFTTVSHHGDDAACIGVPIAGTSAYVLDSCLRLVPPGVTGELYLSGAGLARGYVAAPARTAERFVANPYQADGSRMYRTGDVACWRADGRLEFLGRGDHQVKVRGYRIELGDVEAALTALPGVAEAVALARDGGDTAARVDAYVLLEDPTIEPADLRRPLESKLPSYMVPSCIAAVDAWPRTPSGKIDRHALAAAPMTGPQAHRVAPRTPEETVLCDVLADVLGVDAIGIDDSFFDLGGQSLMATRVVSRVRTALGRDLTIRALFETPTVRRLAERLTMEPPGRARLERRARPARLPLSCAQQRLWFLDQLGHTGSRYVMPEALRIRGPLDVTALARSIQAVVDRHEILRTHFAVDDNVPAQVIADTLPIEMPLEDLRALAPEAREARVIAAIRKEHRTPFDLSCGPLLRLKLLWMDAEEHVLVRAWHHITSDAWSQTVFARELRLFYNAYSSGRAPALVDLPLQYADFAIWERDWLDGASADGDLRYWTTQLDGLGDSLLLPTDRVRPPVPSADAGVHYQQMRDEALAGLKRLAEGYGATLYMLLLSAFAAVLARASGSEQIVVGIPIANRQDEQLEGLIGFFVNALAIRLTVQSTMAVDDLVRQVRHTLLEAYEHQHVPFERVVEALAPERAGNECPIFQVTFALQNAPWEAPQLAGLSVEPIRGETRHARFDLEVHAWERKGRLGVTWLYNADLFDAWRIEHMARQYERVLDQFVTEL